MHEADRAGSNALHNDRGEVPSVAYVGVGSNIDPALHVQQALRELSRHVRITGISQFYRTPALNRSDQPDYLNGVLRVETFMAPVAFKIDVLRCVETALGRQRLQDKYAARCIDLDLVLYDDLVLICDVLRLPDPDIWERAFVSVPLAELAADRVLPGTEERLSDVAASAGGKGLAPEPEFTRELRERFLGREAPLAKPCEEG